MGIRRHDRRAHPRSYAVSKAVFICTLLLAPRFGEAAEDVTWKQQAERLQEVNSAIFDSYPTARPPSDTRAVSLETSVSFLPDVNSTVGGKEEEVPKPPIHAAPVVQWSAPFRWAGVEKSTWQAWAGGLPEGSEALVGLDASMQQWLVGASFTPSSRFGPAKLYFPLGLQRTSAEVTGPVTVADAEDNFQVDTNIFFLSPGVVHEPSGLWSNLLLATKSTDTRFHVEVDKTTIVLDDRLGSARWPFSTQASVGWSQPDGGFSVAFAELLVPERLLMPRLFLSYQYEFGKQ